MLWYAVKTNERLIIIEVIFWQLFDVGHMNEEKKKTS